MDGPEIARAPVDQITGKANVLTLSGHQFFTETCSIKSPIICEFSLEDDPKSRRYSIDVSSLKTGPCAYRGSKNDWATVKLTETVADVTPYEIPTLEDPPQLQKGQPVLQVSMKHFDFKVAGKFPKTVEECFVRDVQLNYDQPIQTDCNSGAWSSGSAQFVRENISGKTVIGALDVSEHAVSQPGSGYNSKTLYNSSVELRGDFLKAVRENLQ